MSQALLLIDFQRDFGAPDGAMAQDGADMTDVPEAVAHAQALADAARAARVPVIFVRLLTTRTRPGELMLCLDGTPGATFYGPQPFPGEIIISKSRFSAFTNTGLAEHLKAQGIDSLVLAGLTTECCVASSAWAAFELDFRVTIAIDACAAYRQALHWETLSALMLSGASLVLSAELTAAWK